MHCAFEKNFRLAVHAEFVMKAQTSLRSIVRMLWLLTLPFFVTSALAAETDKSLKAAPSETYTTGAWLICIGAPQKDQDRIANCTEALRDERIVGIERAWALYERGRGYIGLKNDEAAVTDFTDSLKLNPIAVPVYNDRGVALRHLGKFNDAIADYDAALAREPNHAPALANRGVANDELGRTREAIEDVSKAIAITPEVGDYWQERGSYRTRLELWDDAIGDFDEAVRLQPADARTFNNRGYCHLKRGEVELALKDFNEAIRLNPDYELAKKGRDAAEAKLNK
jgi:tetratricopeptide (TPR) repeat protein